jgi:hypothetical protein
VRYVHAGHNISLPITDQMKQKKYTGRTVSVWRGESETVDKIVAPIQTKQKAAPKDKVGF